MTNDEIQELIKQSTASIEATKAVTEKLNKRHELYKSLVNQTTWRIRELTGQEPPDTEEGARAYIVEMGELKPALKFYESVALATERSMALNQQLIANRQQEIDRNKDLLQTRALTTPKGTIVS